MTPDFEAIERETVRWLILIAVNQGEWVGVGERQVHAVVSAEYPAFPVASLRREVRYLASRGYLTLEVHEGQPWRAQITAAGTDLVEYRADCPPSIKRTPKGTGL